MGQKNLKKKSMEIRNDSFNFIILEKPKEKPATWKQDWGKEIESINFSFDGGLKIINNCL
jgi:hypothetical protein